MLNLLIAKYPSAESIYHDFVNTEEGLQCFEDARNNFPDYNSGGSDTDSAMDMIKDSIDQSLYEQLEPSEIADFEIWYANFEDEIVESIYAGLT